MRGLEFDTSQVLEFRSGLFEAVEAPEFPVEDLELGVEFGHRPVRVVEELPELVAVAAQGGLRGPLSGLLHLPLFALGTLCRELAAPIWPDG